MNSQHSLDADTLTGMLGSLVEESHVEPLGGNHGYMADVFRLHLRGPALPATLVMKQAASSEAALMLAGRYGSYEKESRFYLDAADAAERAGVPVPRCYHNDSSRFLLLLEDLGDTPPFDPAAGATSEDARLAVQTLARLNGGLTGEAGWVAPFSEAFATSTEDFSDFILPFLESLETSAATHTLRQYATRMGALLPRLEQLPQVISHLDCRTDNLRRRGDLLVLLDWGEISLAPVGFDLALFLTTSLHENNRRRWEAELLDTYLKAFNQAAAGSGTPALEATTLWNGYRLALPHGIYLAALAETRGSPDAEHYTRQSLAAVTDHLAFIDDALA